MASTEYGDIQEGPEGASNDWIDSFMRKVFDREYNGVREILRSAVARRDNRSLAEEYAKVLQDFLCQEECQSPTLGQFGVCVLQEIFQGSGRGLVVPGYVPFGAELWCERPLSYVQSQASRRAVQVCRACFVPVGSLGSQLSYLGVAVPPDTTASTMEHSKIVNCPGGCEDVFCSDACCSWAMENSSHRLLCEGQLSIAQAEAARALLSLAEETDHENLILLPHHIAQMILRRMVDEALESVMHRYAKQFISKPWDELVSEECGTEDTPTRRRNILCQVVKLLEELFVGHDLAKPFLDPQFIRTLLGTFDMTVMGVSVPSPFNGCEDIVEFFEEEPLAQVRSIQNCVEDCCCEDDTNTAEIEKESCAPTLKVDDVRDELFADVMGVGVCEAISFTNHSCLPNCSFDFAVANSGRTQGPGLWTYARARRPLLPGDEVLMTYVPSVVGRRLEFRTRKMKEFGFHCKCRSCITDRLLEADGEIV